MLTGTEDAFRASAEGKAVAAAAAAAAASHDAVANVVARRFASGAGRRGYSSLHIRRGDFQ